MRVRCCDNSNNNKDGNASEYKYYNHRNKHNQGRLASTQTMHRHDGEDFEHKGVDTHPDGNQCSKDGNQTKHSSDSTERHLKQQIGITLSQECPLSTKCLGYQVKDTYTNEKPQRYTNNLTKGATNRSNLLHCGTHCSRAHCGRNKT